MAPTLPSAAAVQLGIHISELDLLTIGNVLDWDNLAAKAEPNPSGHTQIDGAGNSDDL